MDREYTDYVDVLRTNSPALAEEIAPFRGLEAVIQWMQRRGLTHAAVDLVGMDEFSYDFLIQLEQNGSWIAFGVT